MTPLTAHFLIEAKWGDYRAHKCSHDQFIEFANNINQVARDTK